MRSRVESAQTASCLSGEAFPIDAPSGWTLAAWHGFPLGWCKITGGTLKNHLPKGLRRRGEGPSAQPEP